MSLSTSLYMEWHLVIRPSCADQFPHFKDDVVNNNGFCELVIKCFFFLQCFGTVGWATGGASAL